MKSVIVAVVLLILMSTAVVLTLATAMHHPAVNDANQIMEKGGQYGLELIAETPEGVKVYRLLWTPKMVTNTQGYLAVSADGKSVSITND